MIGLIVTGHGNFGTGLTSSLKLIAGDPQNYVAVDFPQEDSPEDLAAKLAAAMDSLNECDGILVLSDLPGGSPFKTAVEVGFPRGNVQVIAGTNLPMLIETNLMRGFMEDLGTLVDMAMNSGKDNIVKFEFVAPTQVECEDGI